GFSPSHTRRSTPCPYTHEPLPASACAARPATRYGRSAGSRDAPRRAHARDDSARLTAGEGSANDHPTARAWGIPADGGSSRQRGYYRDCRTIALRLADASECDPTISGHSPLETLTTERTRPLHRPRDSAQETRTEPQPCQGPLEPPTQPG